MRRWWRRSATRVALGIGAFGSVFAAAFGALLLAGLGLFGVVSNIVTRRTHEMGVRIALGARSSQVAGLVLGEGLGLASIGLVLGLPGVYLAGRLLESMLVAVSPWEPRTLASAATLLGAVVFVACALPARRLARIEPGRALRAE